ncbi:MAG: MFS transporter [Methylovirgula sp.]
MTSFSSKEPDFLSRTRRLRTTAVILLVAAGCVNYLDRAALAVGEPEIHQALGLSYSRMGLLLSAFAWSYGLAQIPAGVLVDRFGPRWILGAGLVLWSTAQIAASFVGSLAQFVAARVALGIGESPMYVGGTRVCADWFAPKERALPIAVFNSSSALAPAFAPPLLTWLMIAFGWRTMFLIAGLAGFIITAFWLAFYRAPSEADLPDLAEIPHSDAEKSETIDRVPVLWLLRFQTSWGMFLGFSGVVYISWLYATWLPGYLEQQRHLSIVSAGLWAALPLAAGFLGAISGGFISDRLGRAGMEAVAACRIPTIWGLIAAGGFTVAAAFVGDVYVAVGLMGCGLFAANVSSSCGWALAAVVAPANAVATLEAIQNVGGSVGGALAPFVTGALVQATGSFVPAFVLAGLIAIACAIAYRYMTSRNISAPA